MTNENRGGEGGNLPGNMDQSPERGGCRAPNRDPGVHQFTLPAQTIFGGGRA
ncbi:hypothetical protein K745_gp39 [Haloarcula hispanica virus PH1]|uniref:Uncharacterized protein n=1 Tax=Haloarcula hispanica virus PH1 TaxID=1282967 RepID=M4JFE9_9VIRU|nr:hypothetical protein K745_gp39 [Haloarcula hispanica virus PH1]AGC65564.1 hypothetical protein HhPH1_gp39 [Haloarcula hispanica virus PH1]